MNLSFLNKFEKRCIMERELKGDPRDGLVFSKVNPIKHMDPNVRPNSFSWNSDQFNKRIVGKMISEFEETEKCILFINRSAKKIRRIR